MMLSRITLRTFVGTVASITLAVCLILLANAFSYQISAGGRAAYASQILAAADYARASEVSYNGLTAVLRETPEVLQALAAVIVSLGLSLGLLVLFGGTAYGIVARSYAGYKIALVANGISPDGQQILIAHPQSVVAGHLAARGLLAGDNPPDRPRLDPVVVDNQSATELSDTTKSDSAGRLPNTHKQPTNRNTRTAPRHRAASRSR